MEVRDMLLYLSSSGKSELLDFLEVENEQKSDLLVKKLVGRFSLKQFVVKDMRNYHNYKWFMVDIACIEDTLEDFIIAVQSFQMMFNSHIIAVLSGTSDNRYIEKLLELKVTDIITATSGEELKDEIRECLSKDGMQRYKQRIQPEKHEVIKPIDNKPDEIEIPKYKWKAQNVKIAIAGADRRNGVTVTAFNFANWLIARGATACYVEMNMNRDLHYLIERYTYEKVGEHYPIGDVDCFLINEVDKEYNFIIYDCGVLKEMTSTFKNADKRLVCGSLLPYEEKNYSKLLKLCGNLTVNKMGLCVLKEFQEDCKTTFGEELLIAEASHDLFSDNVNEHIYHPIIDEFILMDNKG